MKNFIIVMYYILRQLVPKQPRELLDIPLTGDKVLESRYFAASNALDRVV